jgi:uncharacterized protein YbjT (DUF2867 family)
MADRVLVIGGTGMFGGAVAAALRRHGHEVALGTRAAGQADSGLAHIDLTSIEHLRRAAEPFDTIVICMPLSDQPRGGFVPERDGVANLLAALAGRPEVRLLKLSEIGAGSDPRFFDLEMKAASDERIRTSGHPFFILRPTWVMQAWESQLSGPGGRVMIPTIGRAVHFVSLADIGRWFAVALERWPDIAGRTLVAQGPEPLTFADAGRLYAERINAKTAPLPWPLLGLASWANPRFRTLYELFRYYNRADEVLQAQDCWALLGPPQVDFRTFLESLGTERDAASTI